MGISRDEFTECHRIFQGAMSALPADDGGGVISLLMSDEEARLWDTLDLDHNNMITFAEFVKWQQEAIQQSGICPLRLTELVQQLSTLLSSIFELTRNQSKAARTRPNPVVDQLMSKVATCENEMFSKKKRRASLSRKYTTSVIEQGDATGVNDPERWRVPPTGISTERLIRKNMREPVPTQNVDSIDIKVQLCMPLFAKEGDEGVQIVWGAKVMRHVKYKGPPSRKDPRENIQLMPYFYQYVDGEWDTLEDSQAYNTAYAELSKDLRIYGLLLAEANFGPAIEHSRLQAVLEDCIHLGLLSMEDVLEYRVNLENAMIAALDLNEYATDGDEPFDMNILKERVATMMPDITFAPLQIMRQMATFGVLKDHPLWVDEEDGI